MSSLWKALLFLALLSSFLHLIHGSLPHHITGMTTEVKSLGKEPVRVIRYPNRPGSLEAGPAEFSDGKFPEAQPSSGQPVANGEFSGNLAGSVKAFPTSLTRSLSSPLEPSRTIITSEVKEIKSTPLSVHGSRIHFRPPRSSLDTIPENADTLEEDNPGTPLHSNDRENPFVMHRIGSSKGSPNVDSKLSKSKRLSKSLHVDVKIDPRTSLQRSFTSKNTLIAKDARQERAHSVDRSHHKGTYQHEGIFQSGGRLNHILGKLQGSLMPRHKSTSLATDFQNWDLENLEAEVRERMDWAIDNILKKKELIYFARESGMMEVVPRLMNIWVSVAEHTIEEHEAEIIRKWWEKFLNIQETSVSSVDSYVGLMGVFEETREIDNSMKGKFQLAWDLHDMMAELKELYRNGSYTKGKSQTKELLKFQAEKNEELLHKLLQSSYGGREMLEKTQEEWHEIDFRLGELDLKLRTEPPSFIIEADGGSGLRAEKIVNLDFTLRKLLIIWTLGTEEVSTLKQDIISYFDRVGSKYPMVPKILNFLEKNQNSFNLEELELTTSKVTIFRNEILRMFRSTKNGPLLEPSVFINEDKLHSFLSITNALTSEFWYIHDLSEPMKKWITRTRPSVFESSRRLPKSEWNAVNKDSNFVNIAATSSTSSKTKSISRPKQKNGMIQNVRSTQKHQTNRHVGNTGGLMKGTQFFPGIKPYLCASAGDVMGVGKTTTQKINPQGAKNWRIQKESKQFKEG